MSALEAIVSLHDVMPDTLSRCEKIIAKLKDWDVPPITLLVVPGLPWTSGQLDRLRALEAEGYVLAAHGWVHRIERIKYFRQWIHSVTLSRRVAEHLELCPEDEYKLMLRSLDWFPQNGFKMPGLYVPPAWALGRIPRSSLSTLPCDQVEVLRGVLSLRSGELIHLPLAGFEADTLFRAGFVRLWNYGARKAASAKNKPIRISLHPQDFDLLLKKEIQTTFKEVKRFRSYAELR